MCKPRMVEQEAVLASAPEGGRANGGDANAVPLYEGGIQGRLLTTIKHNHRWASERGARIMVIFFRNPIK